MLSPSPAIGTCEAAQTTRGRGFFLYLVTVIAGFSNLALEVIGPRILSSYFGTTSVVWSGVIAVTLGGLSTGYLLGGRVARPRRRQALGLALLVAAITVVGTPTVVRTVAATVPSAGYASILTVVTSAFLLPSIAFGMVPPLTVSLLCESSASRESGRVAGQVLAAGTFGSVSGALLSTGFFMPWVGTERSLLCLGLGLVCLGAGVLRSYYLAIVGLIGLVAVPAPPHSGWTRPGMELLDKRESGYQTVRVFQGGGRRLMSLGPSLSSEMQTTTQAATSPYALAILRESALEAGDKALVLGGAGNVLARALEQMEVTVVSVELDPVVAALSDEYFGRIVGRSEITDARAFLARAENEKFDCIVVDAFSGPGVVPTHLSTREFFRLASSRLTSRGVLFFNAIGTASGPLSRGVAAISATLQAEFGNVGYILTDRPSQIQNVVLAAGAIGGMSLQHGFEKGIVLTDDRNPIELLSTPVFYELVARLAQV